MYTNYINLKSPWSTTFWFWFCFLILFSKALVTLGICLSLLKVCWSHCHDFSHFWLLSFHSPCLSLYQLTPLTCGSVHVSFICFSQYSLIFHWCINFLYSWEQSNSSGIMCCILTFFKPKPSTIWIQLAFQKLSSIAATHNPVVTKYLWHVWWILRFSLIQMLINSLLGFCSFTGLFKVWLIPHLLLDLYPSYPSSERGLPLTI